MWGWILSDDDKYISMGSCKNPLIWWDNLANDMIAAMILNMHDKPIHPIQGERFEIPNNS